MPQGRRKVPFSGKKKKQQLIQKRQQKRQQKDYVKKSQNESDDEESSTPYENLEKINNQPSGSKSLRKFHSLTSNRYALSFHKENQKDLALSKERATLPLNFVPKEEREKTAKYLINLDFPTRPCYRVTAKEKLDEIESSYFHKYIERIEKIHKETNRELSLFELNLETWRQLWRVFEMSDILLLIVDIRYTSLMIPKFMFEYVQNTLKKDLIIVLNKIDLVEPELVLAWMIYLQNEYKVLTVPFTSYPEKKPDGNLGKIQKRHNTNIKVHYESVNSIFRKCEKIVDGKLDLSKWKIKILEDSGKNTEQTNEETSSNTISDNDAYNLESSNDYNKNYDFSISDEEENQTELDYSLFYENSKEYLDKYSKKFVRFRDDILTIGCVGFPNVGKSSVINALKGRKVVSVSRTPGHTKHFQTIFLTENVKLCDCPGLVFPSFIPKYIQVIIGSYPISQLRDPYSSIRYVAERIDLTNLLSLKLPSDYTEWSPLAICEAWAIKRRFFTAKASRPDLYRAANHILRLILDGKIVIEFYPPKYSKNYELLKNHPLIGFIKQAQNERNYVYSTEKPINETESSGRSNQSDSETESISDDENIKDSKDENTDSSEKDEEDDDTEKNEQEYDPDSDNSTSE